MDLVVNGSDKSADEVFDYLQAWTVRGVEEMKKSPVAPAREKLSPPRANNAEGINYLMEAQVKMSLQDSFQKGHAQGFYRYWTGTGPGPGLLLLTPSHSSYTCKT